MTRKLRIDSTAEAVRVAQAAARPIEPPSNVPLDAGDLPFFASVLAEFARSEWTAHQLELAAMLAWDMADREKAQRMLRLESEVVTTPKGHLAVNPLRTVVQTLAGSINAGRRSLSLHARAQEGEARDVAKRRGGAKGIEADVDGAGDDLLARPI